MLYITENSLPNIMSPIRFFNRFKGLRVVMLFDDIR